VGLQAAHLASHVAGLRFQRAGHVGGDHCARVALEQLQIELRLQVGNRHADGRRHPAERAGGGGKGTVVDHGKEQFDVVAGKGHPPCCHKN